MPSQEARDGSFLSQTSLCSSLFPHLGRCPRPGVALATLCVARSNLDSGAQEVLKTLEGPPVVMAFGQVVKALAQIRQEDAKGGERSAREALSLFQAHGHASVGLRCAGAG